MTQLTFSYDVVHIHGGLAQAWSQPNGQAVQSFESTCEPMIGPSRAAVTRFRQRLSAKVHSLRGSGAIMVIVGLNPIIRGLGGLLPRRTTPGLAVGCLSPAESERVQVRWATSDLLLRRTINQMGPARGEDIPQALIQRADTALYEAKNGSRDQVEAHLSSPLPALFHGHGVCDSAGHVPPVKGPFGLRCSPGGRPSRLRNLLRGNAPSDVARERCVSYAPSDEDPGTGALNSHPHLRRQTSCSRHYVGGHALVPRPSSQVWPRSR